VKQIAQRQSSGESAYERHGEPEVRETRKNRNERSIPERPVGDEHRDGKRDREVA
jgi:hypothetical protein